ncbi:MAG: glycosyl hydrolase, partial [Candidatus Firestonebacteria bacterium]
MEAWLYDEDRWPSGAAGGLVTKNPKYRQRAVVLTVLDKIKDLKVGKDSLAVFTAKLNGSEASDIKMQTLSGRLKKLAPQEKILHFSVRTNRLSSWYNGFTYLDTLSHEAVKEFIRVTHKEYLKKFGKYFGGVVPGIFTDEPNHGDGKIEGGGKGNEWASALPWTVKLPKVFKERYGYELLPRLVELFYDVDGKPVTRARYHYHDCVTFLFSDAFMRQIGEWCGEHNFQFTGHVLGEDMLRNQTRVVGSAMRSYEHMQAPGMDLLTEHWRLFETAKQVSSAARQFGRKWRLTETYGCTGWDFNFSGQKALGDWQAVCGINLRCQHLSWYTMLGQAKRDYPAGIFYQSPWWEDYRKVEDYFARVNAFNTRGVEVRDILFIHPVESMWMRVKEGWRDKDDTFGYDRMWNKLSQALLANQLDFDYGEEELLSRHGCVKDIEGKATLYMAKAPYRTVLVPPMLTIRATTLELLKKFKDAGGKVIFCGEPAGYIDAVASEAVKLFSSQCICVPADGPAVVKAVSACGRRVVFSDNRGAPLTSVLSLLSEDKDAKYLFACNTGEDLSVPGSLYAPLVETPDLGLIPDPTGFETENFRQKFVRERKVACSSAVIKISSEKGNPPVECDPETGLIRETNARWKDGAWEIKTSFAPLASRMFLVPKKGSAKIPAVLFRDLADSGREKLNAKDWDITLSENNALVLDRPAFRIGGGKWQSPEEILCVDRKVRDALGIERRGGEMVQPWSQKKKLKQKHISVMLKYTFDTACIPSGDLFLALERPETFTLSLNGRILPVDAEAGWWCDRSLRLARIDPYSLKPGKNEITAVCDYAESHSGLEIVYLLGNFGAAVSGVKVSITDVPEKLVIGDWVPQGLPFYSGHVTYRREVSINKKPGEKIFVRVPEYRGTAVRVSVDGAEAGIIAWEPNEIDITGFVKKKKITLCLEVLGHRRNSHGPFHLNEKWPTWTGPAQFLRKDKTWVEGYQLVPCGLMKAPELVFKKSK